jgi:hypothetical protein
MLLCQSGRRRADQNSSRNNDCGFCQHVDLSCNEPRVGPLRRDSLPCGFIRIDHGKVFASHDGLIHIAEKGQRGVAKATRLVVMTAVSGGRRDVALGIPASRSALSAQPIEPHRVALLSLLKLTMAAKT